MDREKLEELMADYLGGELEPAHAAQYETALAEHPDLAGEVASLQRTLSMIRKTDGKDRPDMPLPSKKAWSRAVLPYAAALILAFTAGYFFRSIPLPFTADEHSGGLENPAVGEPLEDWTQTFAEAYTINPGASRLARSLIAFSRALE